mmetsp:Transcript_10165/g.32031  ORF Transcript_10165/g.32031 Transcript_10165/m.32031 type:complete len:348 (+) Transcript_10165:78-1121(+)
MAPAPWESQELPSLPEAFEGRRGCGSGTSGPEVARRQPLFLAGGSRRGAPRPEITGRRLQVGRPRGGRARPGRRAAVPGGRGVAEEARRACASRGGLRRGRGRGLGSAGPPDAGTRRRSGAGGAGGCSRQRRCPLGRRSFLCRGPEPPRSSAAAAALRRIRGGRPPGCPEPAPAEAGGDAGSVLFRTHARGPPGADDRGGVGGRRTRVLGVESADGAAAPAAVVPGLDLQLPAPRTARGRRAASAALRGRGLARSRGLGREQRRRQALGAPPLEGGAEVLGVTGRSEAVRAPGPQDERVAHHGRVAVGARRGNPPMRSTISMLLVWTLNLDSRRLCPAAACVVGLVL